MPFSAPDDLGRFLAVSRAFAVTVPPDMLSVPVLMVDALAKLNVPPLTDNVSSPRNVNDFGVCDKLKMLIVWAPDRSGTFASSVDVGSWPRDQFDPVLQSPPDAFIHVSKPSAVSA